jgi:hypothetical protein
MRISKIAAAALLGVAALGLQACATGLPTKVTRYSAMPVPQGQSFYVVPGKGVQPNLEFNRYASLVAQQLIARGYRQAPSTASADMLVRVTYDVDEGTREVSVDPFARSMYYGPYRGFYDPFYGGYFGRPYYSRFGYLGRYRDPFFYGWDDPFWYSSPYAGYGPGFRDPIREYTVYKSELDVDIVRRADNAPLFDGRAVARSQTDELGRLVPNLIEAMFTNFPGHNGETVRITVPARKG